MFEWLNKLDDEKFLADITPEGRDKRIVKLRRTRLLYLLLLIFVLPMMILMAYLFPRGDLSMMFGVVLLCLISFGVADTQIKTLLLLDKTQTK